MGFGGEIFGIRKTRENFSGEKLRGAKRTRIARVHHNKQKDLPHDKVKKPHPHASVNAVEKNFVHPQMPP